MFKLSPKISRIISRIIVGLIILALLLGVAINLGLFSTDEPVAETANEITSKESEENEPRFAADECNVAGIELHGTLLTYISPEYWSESGSLTEDLSASEYIMGDINSAEKQENIKAIIVEIDSSGGSPVAAAEVEHALQRAKKPTIALIRETGASAAYYAATGAKIIFASPYSDVGGIGVTFSYVDNAGKNLKDGLHYNEINSGIFKDTGDPDKPLTAAERNLIMRDVQIIHDNFVKVVAKNRGLDIEKVEKLADGSTVLGEIALKNGLIDRLGDIYDVKEYLSEQIKEEMRVCW